jgi:uncharacterized membrane protein YgcG
MIKRVFAALVLVLAATSAGARELSWDLLDVSARLDSEGKLHVRERQVMLFDGDWNGGERAFSIRGNQNLELVGIWRVEADGTRVPLTHGSLSAVDEYGWADSSRLRWRSRLPSDPPFSNQKLTYDIEYTLDNILQSTEREDAWLLNHDFAFADRQGDIREFRLHFALDEPWRSEQTLTYEYREGPLPPGQGFIVTTNLTRIDGSVPSSVTKVTPPGTRKTLLSSALAAMVLLLGGIWLGEKRAGRFKALLPVDRIDQHWLQKHVLSLPPEVVGAAWDEKTGAAEVAAILARLTQEGKLATRVEKQNIFSSKLHMELKVDRSTLSGYEKELIDGFFFAGDTTDTDAIRSHYKSTGFDPSSRIKELDTKLAGIPEWKTRPLLSTWKVHLLLFVGLIAAAIFFGLKGGEADHQALAIVGFSSIFVLVFGSILSWSMRTWMSSAALVWTAVPSLLHLGLLAIIAANLPTMAPVTLLILTAWVVTVFSIIVHNGRSTDTPEKFEFRQRLASARNYFVSELKKAEPKLRDEWFPYLIAFGLGSNVDRWFKAFGGAAASRSYSGSSFGSSSSSSSSSSYGGPGGSWSGGGTSFGGAGATGAWAVAAGSLAGGVSAPSSSSSGGGGGGGSSSGGGGGGGW